MKNETVIRVLLSSIVGFIIDQIFSITDIIKEALTPFLVGPFLEPIKPLVILCFFLLEIAGVYEFLEKLNIFDKIGL